MDPVLDLRFDCEDEDTKAFSQWLVNRKYREIEEMDRKEYYFAKLKGKGYDIPVTAYRNRKALKSVEGKQYIRECLARMPEEAREKYSDYSFAVHNGFHNILTGESQHCTSLMIQDIDRPEGFDRRTNGEEGDFDYIFDPHMNWNYSHKAHDKVVKMREEDGYDINDNPLNYKPCKKKK